MSEPLIINNCLTGIRMSSTLSQVMSKEDAVFSFTDQAALEQLVRARIEASSAERLRSRRAIERGQPLEAEDDPVHLATVSYGFRLNSYQ